MLQPIIQVQQLQKRYGTFDAVKRISFDVQPGELFGFIGPNGAGKTTTISMLTTQLRPTGGKASIAGFDINTEADEVRKRIGVIFQDPSLDLELTAYENLWFHGVLYGVPRKVLLHEIPKMIELVGLTTFMLKPVKTFSGGMKRRLEIARGLLHTPEVLFLDEPTLGLDTQTRQHIWGHIDKLRNQFGMTVFLTTHYLEETERCDTIAIIDHGKIIDIGAPSKLKSKHTVDSIEQLFLKLTGHDTRDTLIEEADIVRDEYRSAQKGTNLKPILIIIYRDLLRFWRMKLRSLALMVLPVVWLGLFGPSLAAAFKGADVFGSLGYLTFVFPGALASNLVFNSIGSATSIVAEREFGFLKEVLVAPVSRLSIAIGKTAAGAIIATLSTLPMLLAAPLLGVPITFKLVIVLIPTMLFVAISVSGLGVLIGSRLKSIESAQLVFQFLLFPLLFLSGSFAPISTVPIWLQVLAALNPVTYGVDLLRRATFATLGVPKDIVQSLTVSLHGRSLSIHLDIAVLSLFAAITITAGVFAFTRRD